MLSQFSLGNPKSINSFKSIVSSTSKRTEFDRIKSKEDKIELISSSLNAPDSNCKIFSDFLNDF